MARQDLESILADLHTLDSKIGLIAQRIKTIEQNEEVIGRTLITLNNRLKTVEEKGGPVSQRGATTDTTELEKKFATRQELKEIRYTLDMINPLQYASLQQVRDLVDEKMAKIERSQNDRQNQNEGKKDSRGNIMQSI
jgi:prefoldin subunit 5